MAIKFLNTVQVDTDVLYVDAANDRVGIGTASPSSILHIEDTTPILKIVSTEGFNNSLIEMGNGTRADAGKISCFNNAGISALELRFDNGATGDARIRVGQRYLDFGIDGGTAMRINSSKNVGIGTTTPSTKLEISSSGVNGVDISQSASNATQSGRLFFSTNTASEGFALFNSNGTLQINSGGIPNNTSGTNRISIIGSSGNVGIGTTSPNSELQVNGNIDASGGDGYRIDGRPWASWGSNLLKLGDWDGEGFSTSIFDENTIEIFKVKDQGVIINCDRTSSTTYGVDASLVVGGDKFSPFGAGIVTLLNNDNASQAGDSTGIIQFAIRGDATTSAGYTSASIKGSIDSAAGSGSSGGGILDFLTSTGGLGSSPSLRMRIDKLGNVGIGTTSPQSKLQVNGGVQLSNDTATASATKVGTFRYRTSGNNSYVDMCMQTGASTYAWVNIVTNSW